MFIHMDTKNSIKDGKKASEVIHGAFERGLGTRMH